MINDEFANAYTLYMQLNTRHWFTHFLKKNYPPQYKWVLSSEFWILSYSNVNLT